MMRAMGSAAMHDNSAMAALTTGYISDDSTSIIDTRYTIKIRSPTGLLSTVDVQEDCAGRVAESPGLNCTQL